jgi:hypothetical protein
LFLAIDMTLSKVISVRQKFDCLTSATAVARKGERQ